MLCEWGGVVVNYVMQYKEGDVLIDIVAVRMISVRGGVSLILNIYLNYTLQTFLIGTSFDLT